MRSISRLIWTVVLLVACGPEAPGDGGVSTDAGDAGCDVMCGASCVDTRTDVRHCGGCDYDCTELEGVRASAVSCVEGACVTDGACAADRADCDGDAENGCEADLTSAQRCGACGTSCSGVTPVCTMDEGAGWACSDECAAPTADLCVDTMTNAAHCGACGADCSAPDNATPTCDEGECGFECDAGHLTVNQCRFADNQAGDRGSAIYNFAAGSTPVLVIESSVFENNTGSPAISSHIADVSVRTSTFTNNPAGNIEGGYTNLGGNTPPNP